MIKSPHGTQLTCKGWHQEAAMRMLMNNLDPDVAEKPEQLIVYGGSGKAARNWDCYHKIIETLIRLDNDETLLIQSGKPVGVFRTHEESPRVLIANSHLVPRWANWDEFRKLEAAGLTMFGQMTAGSWIYIGSQGILQGTYETFAECARQHFAGSLSGRLVVTAGLGGMGGAQPLAATMNGAITFDYGNNIRGQVADHRGLVEAFNIKGFVSLFILPLFCQGSGPFRWSALSGNPADIAETDKAIKQTFPKNKSLALWINKVSKQVKFQGLPSRICWLALGERAEMGAKFNWLVKKGKVKAPLVIGRDHLDAGSVASPNRETESMKDGSDAIADWPLLNAFLNTACGASWVSIHHGGGVGIGYSIHSGMVCVADGTELADRRLQRVLTADPGTDVMRHADADYDTAILTAKDKGVNCPMLNISD